MTEKHFWGKYKRRLISPFYKKIFIIVSMTLNSFKNGKIMIKTVDKRDKNGKIMIKMVDKRDKNGKIMIKMVDKRDKNGG